MCSEYMHTLQNCWFKHQILLENEQYTSSIKTNGFLLPNHNRFIKSYFNDVLSLILVRSKGLSGNIF